jgi:hypothetical protein
VCWGASTPLSGRTARSWSRTAGGGGVRVLDHELGALQVFLVVDLGADQVLVAHGVDEERDAVLHHDGVVVVGDLVEGEAVLETRAAAALHEDAQLQVRVAFLRDQLGDLVRGAVREDQRGGHFGDLFGDCAHWTLW